MKKFAPESILGKIIKEKSLCEHKAGEMYTLFTDTGDKIQLIKLIYKHK